MMLIPSTVADILSAALETGGDFAEVFAENTVKNNISMLNGVLEKAISGIDYGVGIRIFNGINAIYAYTNDTSPENLIKVAKEAAAAINKGNHQKVLPFVKNRTADYSPIAHMPSGINKKDIAAILHEASDYSFSYHDSITQTSGTYIDVIQDVLIANSDGIWVEDQRVRTRLVINAVASNANEKQTGSYGPGASKGYEFIRGLDIKRLSEDAARMAVTMLMADECPGGIMPVVIDNKFGGVIFHEACGHSLEATSVARDASVFCGKLNQIIASDVVTAIDDGTLKNEWGTLNVDDEGVPTQKNILIQDGVLKSYLVDKLNGKKMGMESTGSGRRESYRLAPTSRMNNTYIAAGKDKPEDIIADCEYALYAKEMGGGSVRPSTGEFNFAVREGYLIKNGKILKPVRGATLIGKGSEVLMNIDRVANNMDFGQGMCGSISGAVPTNVGQPTLRVKSMTVGGKG